MGIYILSVGINDYGGQLAIPNLLSAVDEAQSVYRVLCNEYNAQGMLFCGEENESDKEHVSSGCGTRSDILQGINSARAYLKTDDLFVFFYSGHGIPDTPGYLLPHSAEYGRPGTYLMYRTLFGILATLPCINIACFLNCCYAGAAAVPANMPGMVVPTKRAVLYAATGKETVTSDRLPGTNGDLSPFTSALLHFLQNEVEEGNSFNPERLGDHLRKQATTDLHLEGKEVKVCPEFVSSVDAIGRGAPMFSIRRPGFGLEFETRHQCATGEKLRIPIKVRDSAHDSFSLEAKPKMAGFKPGHLAIDENNVLEIGFDYPGRFDIEIVAQREGSDEAISRMMSIDVQAGFTPPLKIGDRSLQPCKIGCPYDGSVDIEGGIAPFNIKTLELPQGLQHKWGEEDRSIQLEGTIESNDGGGTPLSKDNGPVIHFVDIELEDSSGQFCRASKRLTVYNPDDYCLVKGGKYVVGCRKDMDTMQAVSKVLQPDINQISARLGVEPAYLQSSVNEVVGGIADNLLDSIEQVAPYAEVQLNRCLIKKYPVTVHDWKSFLKATNSAHIPASNWPPQSEEDMSKPVTGISYEGLCEYLEWKGTRLPTSREWQVAADGGEGNLFPWGNTFDHNKCNMAGGPKSNGTTPVDLFDGEYTSRFGTCDMVGNTAEWVERRVYWNKKKAFAQVFRGGSFRDPPMYGITSCDSREIGVLFGQDEDKGMAGETRFDWLGFRDVIGLDLCLGLKQDVVEIPACEIALDNQAGTGHIDSFWMARYAVSNLEYWEFVKATGHRRPADWQSNGEGLPFPYSKRHLPVVNIGYLDAHAFCLWKSRVEGAIYSLPDTEQWLAAVQGGKQQRYPWGGEYNLQYCNGITSGWGKRVPVFDLSEGQSEQGVFNLVGNVNEWLSPTEWRGGSWRDDCQAIAKRFFKPLSGKVRRVPMDFSSNNLGFRYARLEPKRE